MPAVDDIIGTGNTLGWVQPDGPNTEPKMLECLSMPSITEPRGDVTYTRCQDPRIPNKMNVKATRVGPPGNATATLEGLAGWSASALQKALRRNCPLPTYVYAHQCAPKDVRTEFDWAVVIEDAIATSNDRSQVITRDTNVDVLTSVPVSSHTIVDVFKATLKRVTTAETNPLRDITTPSIPQCAGACGATADECDEVFIACDAGAGVTANVLHGTKSAAGIWTLAACAADPFIADEHISSIVSMEWDHSTTRVIVARGSTAAGDEAEIAWSDDDGATWNPVEFGSTNGEFVLHSGGLFWLDRDHLWVVSNLGNIFFSADGGVTWDEQVQSNTVPLNYVFFINDQVGMAVGGTTGASTVILKTIDGGESWAAVTDPDPAGATVMAWSCTMHDAYRMFVGYESGGLWYSVDGGITWAQRTIAAPSGMTAIGKIYDIKRLDAYGLWMCGDNTITGPAYHGWVMRSIKGGYDWEVYEVATAFDDNTRGLMGMIACSFNHAIAVGNISTTGQIAEVED